MDRVMAERRRRGAGKALSVPVRLPSVGTTIVFRVTCRDAGGFGVRYRDGRVMSAELCDDAKYGHRVVVRPRSPMTMSLSTSTGLVRHVPVLVEVRRPHPGAPWKGTVKSIGDYVETELWASIVAAGLVPLEWTRELVALPYTVARLREVRTRMDSIGQVWGTAVEERAARAWTSYPHVAGLRSAVTRCAHADAADYLRRVLAVDAAAVEVEELKDARQRVWDTMGLILDGQSRTRRERGERSAKQEVPAFELVAVNLPHVHAPALRRAYDIEGARMREVISLLDQKRYEEARAVGGPPKV